MLVEQVQWTDQGSLDLLQYLIRALRRERVLLVISARPEASEHVPPWMTGSDIRTKLELLPFSDDVMERFLDDLFRQVPSFPREVKREILRRAEGNPEMCKELVRLLVDRGALSVDAHHIQEHARAVCANDRHIIRRRATNGKVLARHSLIPFERTRYQQLAQQWWG
jgi:predicted ATPase